MANITKAEREARAAAKAQAEAAPAESQAEQAAAAADDGLVAMSKGSETLRIHPSCVDAHKGAGWRTE